MSERKTCTTFNTAHNHFQQHFFISHHRSIQKVKFLPLPPSISHCAHLSFSLTLAPQNLSLGEGSGHEKCLLKIRKKSFLHCHGTKRRRHISKLVPGSDDSRTGLKVAKTPEKNKERREWVREREMEEKERFRSDAWCCKQNWKKSRESFSIGHWALAKNKKYKKNCSKIPTWIIAPRNFDFLELSSLGKLLLTYFD